MKKTMMGLGLCQLVLLGACMMLGSPAHGQDKTAVELGKVRWTRDLDGAYKQSKETGKPIFAFFQEVPG